jgi:hypothetical protein
MSVNKQYVADLVAELDADKAERKASELPEPVSVVYGVGLDYEPCSKFFASIIDAEMYLHANGYDYIEEINIY